MAKKKKNKKQKIKKSKIDAKVDVKTEPLAELKVEPKSEHEEGLKAEFEAQAQPDEELRAEGLDVGSQDLDLDGSDSLENYDDLEDEVAQSIEESEDQEELAVEALEEEESIDEKDNESVEEEIIIDLPLKTQLESIVFASSKPIKVSDLSEILTQDFEDEEIRAALSELVEEYEERTGGFRLVFAKGMGYQFQTEAKASPLMERLFSKRPRPLSRAAQETLAIVAYRQPVTRAEIEFIRGVDAGSIVKGLLEKNFIRCTGRKDVAGRPMLFGTTTTFMQVFGIESLKELPPLEAFQPAQDVINKAMKTIETSEGLDAKDIDASQFVEKGEDDALAMNVDGIDRPAELSEEVKQLQQKVQMGEDKIEESLGRSSEVADRRIKGAVRADQKDSGNDLDDIVLDENQNEPGADSHSDSEF